MVWFALSQTTCDCKSSSDNKLSPAGAPVWCPGAVDSGHGIWCSATRPRLSCQTVDSGFGFPTQRLSQSLSGCPNPKSQRMSQSLHSGAERAGGGRSNSGSGLRRGHRAGQHVGVALSRRPHCRPPPRYSPALTHSLAHAIAHSLSHTLVHTLTHPTRATLSASTSVQSYQVTQSLPHSLLHTLTHSRSSKAPLSAVTSVQSHPLAHSPVPSHPRHAVARVDCAGRLWTQRVGTGHFGHDLGRRVCWDRRLGQTCWDTAMSQRCLSRDARGRHRLD